jgi:hypothetical protein
MGNLKEREHWRDLGIDKWIILKCILEKRVVNLQNGLKWLSIRSVS